MTWNKATAVLAATLTAVALAACGDSGESNGSTSSGATTGATTASKPAKDLGVLEIVGAAEFTSRGVSAVKAASKELNWTPTFVDPQGDPQKAASGLQNLVTKGSDAILVAPWESTVLRQPLNSAQQANIPVAVFWGQVGAKQGYAGVWFTSDPAFGEKSVEVTKQVAPGGGDVAMFTSPQFYFGTARDKAFKSGIASDPSFKLVATHATDYTNVQADTTKAMNDLLNAHRDLKVVWADSSAQIPPIANVLKDRGKCGKVKVIGFYDDLANLAAVRDGCVTALLTANVEEQTWVAMDLMAGKLDGGKELPPTTPDTYPFDPTQIQVVTKSENLPSDPQEHVPFPYDYVKYFTDKWAKGDYGAPQQ